MKQILLLLVATALSLHGQGFKQGYGHLVRLDYMTEDKGDLSFGHPVDIPLPKYPSSLRKAGIHGEAVVRFRVRNDGKVHDLLVVEQSQREFGDEAATAVAKWKFEWLRRDNVRVSGTIECRFSFVIAD